MKERPGALYWRYYRAPRKRKPRRNANFFSRIGRPKKGLEEMILKKEVYIPIWRQIEWLATKPSPIFHPKVSRFILVKRKWKGSVTSIGFLCFRTIHE